MADEQTDKNLETLNHELITLIRLGSLDKKHGGLDRSSYTLLHHLSNHDKVGVKALAEEFGLDTSTISRQTSVLEAKDYVVKVPDPQDGRSSYFQITALGAQTFAGPGTSGCSAMSRFLKAGLPWTARPSAGCWPGSTGNCSKSQTKD